MGEKDNNQMEYDNLSMTLKNLKDMRIKEESQNKAEKD